MAPSVSLRARGRRICESRSARRRRLEKRSARACCERRRRRADQPGRGLAPSSSPPLSTNWADRGNAPRRRGPHSSTPQPPICCTNGSPPSPPIAFLSHEFLPTKAHVYATPWVSATWSCRRPAAASSHLPSRFGREGIVVTGRWQLALDTAGRHWLWCTRGRQPGAFQPSASPSMSWSLRPTTDKPSTRPDVVHSATARQADAEKVLATSLP